MDGAGKLRAAGMRVTATRLAILEVMREGRHLDADEVARAVRDRVGHVTLQAIYEALGAFTEAGLVRKIDIGSGPARYESRVGDNHHHLVCRSCGAVEDVDCATGHAPCLEPATRLGYIIDQAEVTFWGLCEKCQAALPFRLSSAELDQAVPHDLLQLVLKAQDHL